MKQKLAFVFPGQGSQSVGMLNSLAEEHSLVEETFHEAQESLDYDLWRLVCRGSEEQLNQTEFTQPALLVAGVAVWRVWLQEQGILPIMLAGHSLGEYTALVCANAINLTDAVKLVETRGRLMQDAVPQGQGGMAAIIGLSLEKVNELCETVAEGEVLAPANMNAPGQIVVSGTLEAVQRAVSHAKEFGAKLAKTLPVSVPSHSYLMKEAAEKLKQYLADVTITAPDLPVINNVDVANYETPDQIRDGLIRQLYSPVRWIETIEYMGNNGIELFVECGPGKVLAGLNKRILRDVPTISIAEPANITTAFNEE